LHDEGEKVCNIIDWTFWTDEQFLNSTNHDTPELKCSILVCSLKKLFCLFVLIWRTLVHYNLVFYIRERYVLAYSLLCFLCWIGCHICMRTYWYKSLFWLFLRNEFK
jgi:hypothetical protein